MSSGPAPPQTDELVEHFFRHQSGRLTAALVRRFGAERIDDIEDAVQVAFERALGSWPRRGIPDEPAAWLMRVAKNRLIDGHRQKRREAPLEEPDDRPSPTEQSDDLLTLLFACADDRLAPRARLVLCLKLVCGFSTNEIAMRLFMTPANVQKTLERGRQRLRASYERVARAARSQAAMDARLSTVQQVLYLTFNEGYSLGEGDVGLRVELCDEAIRLTGLLVQHPIGDVSSTWALLALMHFHAMRLPARLDQRGRFVPLAEQDRSLWDIQHKRLGFACMEEVTRDHQFTRYHGEAAIQVEYALAPSIEAVRWAEIVALYAALEKLCPSPLYTLNRAIAQAEATSTREGLEILTSSGLPSWFRRHPLFQAALGELYRREGEFQTAAVHFEAALASAPSSAEKGYFSRQLRVCQNQE